MMVNINQCASTYDETLHVMRFSAVAKQVSPLQHQDFQDLQDFPGPQSQLTPPPVCRWCRWNLWLPVWSVAMAKLW